MDSRQIMAIALLLLIIAAIGVAILLTTREARHERRSHKRGERARLRRRDQRLRDERAA